MVHLLRGDVMLVSLFILIAVALGFTVVGLMLSAGEGQGGVAALNKAEARSLASSCVEMAMDDLGRDMTYSGSETVTIGSSSCYIRPITASSTWVIEAEAVYGNERSRQRAVLSSCAPVSILSWTEVASF